jgi:hypothetical protein
MTPARRESEAQNGNGNSFGPKAPWWADVLRREGVATVLLLAFVFGYLLPQHKAELATLKAQEDTALILSQSLTKITEEFTTLGTTLKIHMKDDEATRREFMELLKNYTAEIRHTKPGGG